MAIDVIFNALNHLITQLIVILPKLIIALLIWYVGKYILSFTSSVIRKFDIKSTDMDDIFIDRVAIAINVVGRIVLIMVILDFLGIGSSIIAAVAQGVTFAVAIALGISFGKALEPDAKKMVEIIRHFLHK